MPRSKRSYEQKKELGRLRQRKIRAQEENKIKEREKDKLRKRMNRQDPEYAEQCRRRNREYKRKCRAQEEYRIKEREQNKLYKRKCRENPEFVSNCRERDREYRRRIRTHESYKKMERVRNQFYKMMAKQKLTLGKDPLEDLPKTKESELRSVRLNFRNTSKEIEKETENEEDFEGNPLKKNQNILQAVHLKFRDNENLSEDTVCSSSNNFESFTGRHMVFIKQEIQEQYSEED